MAETLTPKQRLFVTHYLKDLNATQAAKDAGYSEDSAQQIGSENLSKPLVIEAIARAMDRRVKRLEIDADYVLATIQDTIERCREDAEHGSVLKGCELLGKHLKLWTEKVEMTGKDGGPIETREMSDEQLDARFAELLAKANAKPEGAV